MNELLNKTPLELFDYCAAKITEQGARSADDVGTCFYRGDNGLKCAAGFTIPDDRYRSSMESHNFRYVNAQYNLGFSEEQVNAVMVVQKIHDSFEVPHWESAINGARTRLKT